MKNVSARMDYAEIDVRTVKTAVNAILDHLIEDLGVQKVVIAEEEDFYWDCDALDLHDRSKPPILEEFGRLKDDVEFLRSVRRGRSGDASYSLIHVAPLLRYIAEKVKR